MIKENSSIAQDSNKGGNTRRPTSHSLSAKHHDIIQGLRLMDDVFMKMVFHDNPAAVQLVIRTILDNHDLVVKSYREQININNILGRSVILDILAEDSDGIIYNIEVQRSSKQATPRRLRYYSSLIDTYYLKKSDSYESLPEKYIIFIMEDDYYKKGKPLYEFMMELQDTEKFLLKDGQHLIYVNGSINDNTDLGRLMHDFQEPNPDKMYYQELRTRAKYYKTNKEGEENMKSAVDELYEKGVNEGEARGIAKGEARGIAKGEARGIAKGEARGKTESIMNAVSYLKKSSSKSVAIEMLMGMFGLSKEAATKYYMAA